MGALSVVTNGIGMTSVQTLLALVDVFAVISSVSRKSGFACTGSLSVVTIGVYVTTM